MVVKANNGGPPFELVFPAQKLFQSPLSFCCVFLGRNKTFWIVAIFEKFEPKISIFRYNDEILIYLL